MAEQTKGPETRPEIENKAKVLILGTFGPGDIEITMTDHTMPKNPELETKIEEEWAPKAARGWFAGPLVRVESFGMTPEGKLSVTFGKTDFKEYTGSRDLASLRQYGYEGISNPLSSSSVIITSDNKMVICRKLQGDAIGSVDAIGGYAHPEKDLDPEKGVVYIFRTAKREVLEEALVKEDEISEIWCLGLSYEYAGLCHPVASFVMRTPLSSQELQNRIKGKEEEISLVVVDPKRIPDSDSDVEYVMGLLEKAYPNVEPDGRVTIALARKWLSGKRYEKGQLRTTSQI